MALSERKCGVSGKQCSLASETLSTLLLPSPRASYPCRRSAGDAAQLFKNSNFLRDKLDQTAMCSGDSRRTDMKEPVQEESSSSSSNQNPDPALRPSITKDRDLCSNCFSKVLIFKRIYFFGLSTIPNIPNFQYHLMSSLPHYNICSGIEARITRLQPAKGSQQPLTILPSKHPLAFWRLQSIRRGS